jgi:putative Ig domain-containing protein
MFLKMRSKCAPMVAVCLLVLTASSRAAADSMTLEWDPIDGQVGYTVHVGQQTGSYTQHFDVASGTLFTFTNAIAGQRYCFAVSAYLVSSHLEGPNSTEVCGYSNTPPTLVNPGDRSSAVGDAVTLQLQGSDADAQPLTYSATGLPPGLTMMASTGFISGTGTTAGSYSVTARASDGTLTTSQAFTWTITATAGGPTDTVTLTTAPGSSWKMVSLTWTKVSWPSVDIYRNNVKIKNQRNTGSASNTVPDRGTYDYRVCAPDSTTLCSNVSSIVIE